MKTRSVYGGGNRYEGAGETDEGLSSCGLIHVSLRLAAAARDPGSKVWLLAA